MLRVCVLVRNVLLSKVTGFKIVSIARVTTFTEFLIPLRFLPIDRRSCKIYARTCTFWYLMENIICIWANDVWTW